jgi:hypothetical protein
LTDAPSPKRPRTENNTTLESQGQDNQQVLSSGAYVKSYVSNIDVASEHKSEEESEEDNRLLIDQIT